MTSSPPNADAKPNKSLVLVIGAGASYEANLPLGSDLKHRIAELLDIRYDYRRISGDALIDGAFRALTATPDGRGGDINPYLYASWRIRDAMPQAISIDNFIDSHRGDSRIAECGKLAIARSILEAEASSPLKLNPRNGNDKLNFKALEKTWFNAFFQVLTENCQESDIPERFAQVEIICFNYDRCIEHYLYLALQNYYGMQPQVAATAVSGLEISHPYGTVGRLPWATNVATGIDFGETPSPKQLLAVSKELRTFTEGSDEHTTDVARVRNVLANAERIAFLGFAFHRLNVEFLFPRPASPLPTRVCPVFATGVGVSTPDAKAITQELYELAGLNPGSTVIAQNTTCAGLFSEFRRSMGFR